jgi:hypothetical protein
MLIVILLIASHAAALGFGFLLGVYLLPILTAPKSPDAETLRSEAARSQFKGRFERKLKGSDPLHWGEGDVGVLSDKVVHEGRLAPGPDYKLYLAPSFVDTKQGFLAIKEKSRRIGDVKTFSGFIVEVPRGIDVRDYTTAVVWCEAFSQFISAAKYR